MIRIYRFLTEHKHVFLALAPFFLACLFYLSFLFMMTLRGDNLADQIINYGNNIVAGVYVSCLKCLPVACLTGFVVAQNPNPVRHNFPVLIGVSYKSIIALGLTLGMFGDALLVFRRTFIYGMAMFMLQHACLIYAMGYKPLRPYLGVGLFAITSVVLILLMDEFPDQHIRRAMPIYSVFLVSMCWRALSRATYLVWRIAGAIGGVLFVLSDIILILNFTLDFPYAEIIIISLYYSAQMCFALTVLDPTTVPSVIPPGRR